MTSSARKISFRACGALQYISYTTPWTTSPRSQGHEREQSHAAKDAMAQILITAACAPRAPPICQDTGIVTASSRSAWTFTSSPSAKRSKTAANGRRRRRRAYLDRQQLRASILATRPARAEHKDNTPASVAVELVKAPRSM